MLNKHTRILPTKEQLAMTSLERLIAGSNFKRQWSLFLTEDLPECGLKKNATFESVSPHPYPPYTGKANFTISRVASGVPYGYKTPVKAEIPRGILIRQITASEIVEKIGVGNKVYAGQTKAVKQTVELAEILNGLYNLGLTESDIVDQKIQSEASCVIVYFARDSVGFTGSFIVDLYTPIVNPEEIVG